MAEKTVIEINSGGRKPKTRNPTPRKEYIDQDPLGLKFTIPCRHKSEKTKFRCSKIPIKIIIANRKKFYLSTAKVQQDLFLSRLISPYEPERRNKIPLKGTKAQTLSCSYHLLAKNQRAVPVCKKLFMATFDVSEKRLRNLNKTIHKGFVPKENRGGDHQSHKTIEKKNMLREFLNNLPAKESHYNRSKSKRIYLSSQLNATKLLKLYNDSVTIDYKVKPGMFYKIFHGEYNIGFSTPASDVCSTCTLLMNKIKVEQDPYKKVELMTQKRIHKLRANSFYEIMKSEVPSSMSLCFDLQQVLPLPRTPISDSFYCRQVSLYNFCIVDLDNNKPYFYVWDETQANRGSVEIGSALYSHLSSLNICDEIKILRLFCDGCGGQNKNSHIIHTLLQWLYAKAPPTLKCIQITYPVRGHSFLPADRVFGRIEKDLRKTPIITTREVYFDFIKRHGKLQELGKDWLIKDLKSLTDNLKKLDSIQSLKRIHIIKKYRQGTHNVLNCIVKSFEHFKFESGTEEAISLLKKGKRIPLEIPNIDLEFIPLSVKKKKDVESLLIKQFGENWSELEDLRWYNRIVNGQESDERDEEQTCDHYDDCDCTEYDFGNLRV